MHYHLNLSPSVSLSEFYLEQWNGCSWQLLLRSEANISDISTWAVGATFLNSFDLWCFDKTHPKWWKNNISVLLLNIMMIITTNLTNFLIPPCDTSAENLPSILISALIMKIQTVCTEYTFESWIIKVKYSTSLIPCEDERSQSIPWGLLFPNRPPTPDWMFQSGKKGSGVAVLPLMWLLSHLQIECDVGSRASDSCWSSWSTWNWCRRELLD